LNAVIIVAGGIGRRMGSHIPKQFLLLKGLPVILHSVKPFIEFDPKINVIIVLPKEHISTWQAVCKKFHFHVEHKIVVGGETRYQSVKNGLQIVNNSDFIAVHDSVRPLITKEFVNNCFESAFKNGNAIPCVDIDETVREIHLKGNKQLDRSVIKLIQTPQVFKTKELKEAYKLPFLQKFTDDASVVEAAGVKINLINGLKQNIKITTEIDLKIAECFLINKKK
jgi:2-C-methyl-D-erythritol 4-phosphate cytidylyltransferase